MTLILLLAVTNIATLVIYLREKPQAKDPKVQALVELVRAVEHDGSALLRIELVDPDSIFLRSPRR